MSILLRHVDIPEYGHRIVVLSDGHAYYEDFINPFVDLGEVVLVPTHGRLGDLDKLEDGLRHMAKYQHGERLYGVLGCCETIRLAPTIVPADKEGEA